MTITSVRIASEADAKAVAEVANAHELSVDINSSLMGEQAALGFIAGYVDPSFTYLISIDDELGFSAVVNLHADSIRERYFTDIYAKPQVENLERVVRWAIELAESEHPAWEIWPGANFQDNRLRSAWTSHGFEFLRRYFTMRLEISSLPTVRQVQGIEIRAIDISNPDEVAQWHKVHQDAFSKHFDFAPRDLANWSALMLDDVNTDPSGVFGAFRDGEPVGFCNCSDEYAEENKGQITTLAVTLENQGLGIGEALLQTGILYCATKGYDTVELNVDTGNETGALKLYEKVGFKPESSWIQMHRPR